MSLLDKDTEVFNTVSGFGFSAARPDDLANISNEFTLVEIDMDVSASVSDFKGDLEKAYRTIIEACGKNPKKDNLLVRATSFNSHLKEDHGFVPLSAIDPNGLVYKPSGCTALYDAALSSLESVDKYGGTLADQGFLVNGVIFIITDGEDNASYTGNPQKIKDYVSKIRKSESLESVKIILIGIGSGISTYLGEFNTRAGFDQFEMIQQADAKGLAQMADFVSRSISSTSQALGTGGPSQNLSI